MAKAKQTHVEKTQTSKKKLSLNEFRAWLSGVEEMQDDNWTPSATQWRTIRAKIEEVIDAPMQQIPRRVIEYDNGGYDDRHTRPSGPSAFSAPTHMPSSNGAPPIPGIGGAVKTPDIDTSKAPYVSSLE